MPTYEEAIDLMYATFSDAWTAGAAAIVGYVPDVRYEGVPDQTETKRHDKTSRYWARLTVRNAFDNTAGVGRANSSEEFLYESVGNLSIEIYGPKQDNAAITKLRRLAMLSRSAYRGVASGGEVVYTEVTIRERPPEDRWQRIDVTAVYNYHETE
ncbi:minor tail protein [Paracoccus phage vB_PmaS-R3]|uniref:Minor tail protein n=1 Tax=Paracoccus phage vB_PmaS-R3 TaxID=2494563 RepID=A0A0B5A0E7_9CAUD|nr:minor tail protein [Paracoccus phage vB_PmaS-R3]AJD83167.1 minor tail protein [Paracoccus phage vB_PmaS-R3]